MTINKQQNAESYYGQGLLLCAQGKDEDALECFQAALDINENHAPSYAKIAEILIDNGEVLNGVGFWGLAVKADPQNADYAKTFLGLVRHFELQSFNPELKNVLLLCLKNKNVDFQSAAPAWLSLLKASPDFRQIYKASHQNSYKAFKKMVLRNFDAEVLCDPYFVLGLTRQLVFDPVFERFLTGLRHMLLDEMNEPAINLNDSDFIELSAALAQYCYSSEYIFASDAHETEILDKLHNNATKQPKIACIYACYRPLHGLNGIEIIRDKIPPSLRAQQLDEWFVLQNMREKVQNLTTIADDVSQKVQEQYEEFPYPRWRYLDIGVKNESNEGFLRNDNPDILVAGCGTGREAAELAATYPNANILAVDLSRTSLSYGLYKAEENNIENVIFRQGDILELGKLDRTFDFIASSGVLHHMADPMAGWNILVGLLKPGGTMRIGLYSETAREAVIAARTVIAENCFTNDSNGIRRFRTEAPQFMNKHTYDRLCRLGDYFSMSECRDLLFHVQEHRFTLPQLKDALDTLGLDFKGFYLKDSVLDEYRKTYPADQTLTNLDNWQNFEKAHPDTFIEMYRFWCIKTK